MPPQFIVSNVKQDLEFIDKILGDDNESNVKVGIFSSMKVTLPDQIEIDPLRDLRQPQSTKSRFFEASNRSQPNAQLQGKQRLVDFMEQGYHEERGTAEALENHNNPYAPSAPSFALQYATPQFAPQNYSSGQFVEPRSHYGSESYNSSSPLFRRPLEGAAINEMREKPQRYHSDTSYPPSLNANYLNIPTEDADFLERKNFLKSMQSLRQKLVSG